MSRRTAKWVGVILAAGSALGMGSYFITIGLDKADKLASVAGAFIGLAGLILAIYGFARGGQSDLPAEQPPAATVQREDMHNEIRGGTYHGPVLQGRNFGAIKFNLTSPEHSSQDDSDASVSE